MGKDTSFSIKKSITLRGKTIDFSRPLIMGILNLTPDSFYDGGRYHDDKTLKNRINALVAQGADIVDIGAYSSRPGADPVSEKEEMLRLRRGLDIFRSLYPDFPVSVDTFRASVAGMSCENFKVDMINDISAGEMDEKMFETVAGLHVPYVIMHMQGTPQTMQDNPGYVHVVKEIIAYFSRKLSLLRALNVCDVIVDPGFGFGKTIEHNYQILRALSAFRMLDVPVMVGVSRKSMIFKVLDTSPDLSLNGTTVLHTLALLGGADIIRVHDPREARETIELVRRFKETNLPHLSSRVL
jgi:dihydropteroate synthase